MSEKRAISYTRRMTYVLLPIVPVVIGYVIAVTVAVETLSPQGARNVILVSLVALFACICLSAYIVDKVLGAKNIVVRPGGRLDFMESIGTKEGRERLLNKLRESAAEKEGLTVEQWREKHKNDKPLFWLAAKAKADREGKTVEQVLEEDRQRLREIMEQPLTEEEERLIYGEEESS